ncbi:hypothetical protein Tdes44962_MAKER09588 [Teratosphaeria destructans]|uniref:Uncharacterized protein n=1 Tax=Teratosphaeria destructans TaxID=418781 RepID=A0A9W7W2Y1_9PEZI|nr:hypothetical protein Tdes44962_MAKER09588 [Teratosphaeria destructans]
MPCTDHSSDQIPRPYPHKPLLNLYHRRSSDQLRSNRKSGGHRAASPWMKSRPPDKQPFSIRGLHEGRRTLMP